MVVVGTRPNFIKITQFEKAFKPFEDKFSYQLIHTGQHFDHKMSEVFFEKLKLKKPDFNLAIQESDRELRLAKMTATLADLFAKEQADLVMVVGDVDSTLAAARAAKSNGIKVAHVESGLRSFDREMPEEVNRIEVDQIADYLFVTEQSGLDNLRKEGRSEEAIFFVGNTMIDTLVAFDQEIQHSTILEKHGLQKNEYVLTTLHRPRNVDSIEKLKDFIEILEFLAEEKKIVWPLHPRTKDNFDSIKLSEKLNENLILVEPLDYLEFQKLIANAYFVLTDSGGIQEETTFRKVPCITLRPNTERPSTLDSGCNQLVDIELAKVKEAVAKLNNFNAEKISVPEFWDGKSTDRIVEVLDRIF
ncbi:MAG: UDP-N-acetylglucosamine 2-epimerase (non-hydrolyzing) [Vicingaceae bacterium]